MSLVDEYAKQKRLRKNLDSAYNSQVMAKSRRPDDLKDLDGDVHGSATWISGYCHTLLAKVIHDVSLVRGPRSVP